MIKFISRIYLCIKNGISLSVGQLTSIHLTHPDIHSDYVGTLLYYLILYEYLTLYVSDTILSLLHMLSVLFYPVYWSHLFNVPVMFTTSWSYS